MNSNARIVRPGKLRPRLGDSTAIQKPQKQYSEHTLIIHYKGKKGKKSLLKAVKKYKATVIYNYGNINAIAIQLPENIKVEDAKAHFEKVKGVRQVNYDRIMRIM